MCRDHAATSAFGFCCFVFLSLFLLFNSIAIDLYQHRHQGSPTMESGRATSSASQGGLSFFLVLLLGFLFFWVFSSFLGAIAPL
jgi:hypothetical protein